MKKEIWNKCDHCGRFISYKSFPDKRRAIRQCVSIDSEFSIEGYETYHTRCKEKKEAYQIWWGEMNYLGLK